MTAIVPAYRCKPVYSQKSWLYTPAGVIGYILALINFNLVLGLILLLAGFAIYFYEFRIRISNYHLNGFILFNALVAATITFLLCRNVGIFVYFVLALILGIVSYKPYKFYVVSPNPVGIFAGLIGYSYSTRTLF